MSCGIYYFRNKLNNKYYIGQSINIELRYKRHVHSALTGLCSDSGTKFHKALRELGVDSFDFEIITLCSSSDLNKLENLYIKEFNSVANGYNSTYGGNYTEHFIKLSEYELDSIIDLLKNTDLSYNTIASEFNISYNMVRYINYGLHHNRDDLQYPIRPYKYARHVYKCVVCDEVISRGCTYCNYCRRLYRIGYTESPIKPDRKTLKDLIRSKSFTKIGLIFNVSDNAIRKWCKWYNLPYKSRDIKLYTNEEWENL